MQDILERLLRAAPDPDPDRADALWAGYRDRGDEAAFATLLAWYGPRIYRLADYPIGSVPHVILLLDSLPYETMRERYAAAAKSRVRAMYCSARA